jgi:hypothetical protein
MRRCSLFDFLGLKMIITNRHATKRFCSFFPRKDDGPHNLEEARKSGNHSKLSSPGAGLQESKM